MFPIMENPRLPPRGRQILSHRLRCHCNTTGSVSCSNSGGLEPADHSAELMAAFVLTARVMFSGCREAMRALGGRCAGLTTLLPEGSEIA